MLRFCFLTVLLNYSINTMNLSGSAANKHSTSIVKRWKQTRPSNKIAEESGTHLDACLSWLFSSFCCLWLSVSFWQASRDWTVSSVISQKWESQLVWQVDALSYYANRREMSCHLLKGWRELQWKREMKNNSLLT